MKIKKFLPILVVLLVLFAAFTVMTVSASAEELTPSEGLEFTLSGNKKYYSVTGEGSFNGTELIIPSTYQGLPVQAIAREAFRGNTTITKLVIPDSVINVGHAAFMECTSLTDVTLSKNMSALATYMFGSCSSLGDIVIPEGIKAIGAHAFRASSITSISIPSTVTRIGQSAFRTCRSLTSVVIPDTVTSVDHATFYGCAYLKEVTIGGGITKMANYMFYNCRNLKTVNFNEGVTSTGTYSFEQCVALKTINFPKSMTTLEARTFYGCKTLVKVVLPENLTTIKNLVFVQCAALESVVMPASVTSIGNQMCTGCTPAILNIYYQGDAEGFATAVGTSSNSVLKNATRYYTEDQPMEKAESYWHYVDGVPTIWEAYVAPPVEEPSDYTLSEDGTYYTITGSTIELAGVTNLVLPATYKDLPVKAIAANAFAGNTTLKTLVIGADVAVADGAFDGSAVTDIYFEGAVADWTCVTTATVYFYSATQPTVEGNFWSYVDGEIVLWATAGDDDGIELPPVGI